jgi:hypothetical protein
MSAATYDHASAWALKVVGMCGFHLQRMTGILSRTELEDFLNHSPADKQELLGKDFRWDDFFDNHTTTTTTNGGFSIGDVTTLAVRLCERDATGGLSPAMSAPEAEDFFQAAATAAEATAVAAAAAAAPTPATPPAPVHAAVQAEEVGGSAAPDQLEATVPAEEAPPQRMRHASVDFAVAPDDLADAIHEALQEEVLFEHSGNKVRHASVDFHVAPHDLPNAIHAELAMEIAAEHACAEADGEERRSLSREELLAEINSLEIEAQEKAGVQVDGADGSGDAEPVGRSLSREELMAEVEALTALAAEEGDEEGGEEGSAEGSPLFDAEVTPARAVAIQSATEAEVIAADAERRHSIVAAEEAAAVAVATDVAAGVAVAVGMATHEEMMEFLAANEQQDRASFAAAVDEWRASAPSPPPPAPTVISADPAAVEAWGNDDDGGWEETDEWGTPVRVEVSASKEMQTRVSPSRPPALTVVDTTYVPERELETKQEAIEDDAERRRAQQRDARKALQEEKRAARKIAKASASAASAATAAASASSALAVVAVAVMEQPSSPVRPTREEEEGFLSAASTPARSQSSLSSSMRSMASDVSPQAMSQLTEQALTTNDPELISQLGTETIQLAALVAQSEAELAGPSSYNEGVAAKAARFEAETHYLKTLLEARDAKVVEMEAAISVYAAEEVRLARTLDQAAAYCQKAVADKEAVTKERDEAEKKSTARWIMVEDNHRLLEECDTCQVTVEAEHQKAVTALTQQVGTMVKLMAEKDAQRAECPTCSSVSDAATPSSSETKAGNAASAERESVDPKWQSTPEEMAMERSMACELSNLVTAFESSEGAPPMGAAPDDAAYIEVENLLSIERATTDQLRADFAKLEARAVAAEALREQMASDSESQSYGDLSVVCSSRQHIFGPEDCFWKSSTIAGLKSASLYVCGPFSCACCFFAVAAARAVTNTAGQLPNSLKVNS